jgi:hypothetical protein
VVDSPPRSIRILDGVSVEVLHDHPFDEERDATVLMKLASSLLATHVIIDSYRVTNRWVQATQSRGFFVSAFDDQNALSAADLRINYSPGARRLGTGALELVGPQYFVTDTTRKERRCSKPRSIIFHVGGNGEFPQSSSVIGPLVMSARRLGLETHWLIAHDQSRTWLDSSGWLSEGDHLHAWQVVTPMDWSPFDIVVGPPSTSLFEAIMHGVLPISFVVSETQKDERSEWLSIGHGLHLTRADCQDGAVIGETIGFAVRHYARLTGELGEYAGCLDGLGARRVAEVMCSTVPQKAPEDHESGVKSEFGAPVRRCRFGDAEAFRAARNAPLVRELSTSNREIPWLEHLNWWLATSNEKFVFEKDGSPLAYFWHSSRSIVDKRYLVGGWFPAREGPMFGVAVQLLTWQLQYCRGKYPDHTWLATIDAGNRAVIELNRRLGFVDPGPASRADAERLFPGTLSGNFVVLERQACL